MSNRIKVVIVDDSLMFREFLSRSLNKVPNMDVVGVFSTPLEAQHRLSSLQPDVLAVDMEMPGMRGDEFLKKVLPLNPGTKAVVISSTSSNVFDAMHAGAVDFVAKPGSRPGYDNTAFLNEVISKLTIAAKAQSGIRRPAAVPQRPLSAIQTRLSKVSPKSIIAIGASTGGTEALVEVIKRFPADVPGTIIVQHMPPVFTSMFADRVNRLCKPKVSEAKNGDRIERGTVLIAPGGDEQLKVARDARGYFVRLYPGEKVSSHCPSVDVMFESVALAAGSNAVAAILTGMGSDGANGLLKIRKTGAHTVGQDKDSCVVYGMPKVAYDIGAVEQQKPITEIADALLRYFR